MFLGIPPTPGLAGQPLEGDEAAAVLALPRTAGLQRSRHVRQPGIWAGAVTAGRVVALFTLRSPTWKRAAASSMVVEGQICLSWRCPCSSVATLLAAMGRCVSFQRRRT
jgi:hypothetical protein